MDPNNTLQNAQLLVEQQQYDRALEEYAKLLAINPADTRVLLRVGDVQARAHNFAGAIHTYDRAGEHYAGQGASLKAIAVYKQVRELIHQHEPSLIDQYAHVVDRLTELYLTLGLVNDALRILDDEANRLRESQRDDDALRLFLRMTEVGPNVPLPHLRLAEGFYRVGKVDDALRSFSSATSLLLAAEQPDDALRVVERMLHIKPDPKRAKLAAKLYLAKGTEAEGMQALSRLQISFQATPNDIETLDLLAQAFELIGHPERSVEVKKELCRVAHEQGNASVFKETLEQLEAVAPQDEQVQALHKLGVPGGSHVPAQPPSSSAPAAKQMHSTPPPKPARSVAPPRLELVSSRPPPLPQSEAPGSHQSIPGPPPAPQSRPSMTSVAPPHPPPSSSGAASPPPLARPSVAAIGRARLGSSSPHAPPPAHRPSSPGGSLPPAMPSYPPKRAPAPPPRERATAPAPPPAAMSATTSGPNTGAALERATTPGEVPSSSGRSILKNLDEVYENSARALADAQTYRSLSLFHKGIETTLNALEFDPKSIELREMLRDLYTDIGDRDGAIEQMLLMAEVYNEFERPDHALAVLQNILDEEPDCNPAEEMVRELLSEYPELNDGSFERFSAGQSSVPARNAMSVPAPEATESSVPPAMSTEVLPPPPSGPPGPESSGASARPSLEDALEEVEFFSARGMFSEAKRLLDAQLALYPSHPLLLDAQTELEEAMADSSSARDSNNKLHAGKLLRPSDSLSADLRTSLNELENAVRESMHPASGGQPTPGVDVDDLFDRFKHSVKDTVAENDAASHYDLGLAYKDMHLLDDAIEELELAAQDPRFECNCYAAMGLIYAEQSMWDKATKSYTRALNASQRTSEQEVTIYYDLAHASEQLGQIDQAVYYMRQVLRRQHDFRDAKARAEQLSDRKLRTPSGRPRSNDDDVDRAFEEILGD